MDQTVLAGPEEDFRQLGKGTLSIIGGAGALAAAMSGAGAAITGAACGPSAAIAVLDVGFFPALCLFACAFMVTIRLPSWSRRETPPRWLTPVDLTVALTLAALFEALLVRATTR